MMLFHISQIHSHKPKFLTSLVCIRNLSIADLLESFSPSYNPSALPASFIFKMALDTDQGTSE